MTTLGARLSRMLRDRGVDTIFGIPGVHNVELYRGIEEAGLRHVLARHEQGAGFMADGYARATGRPGICCRGPPPGNKRDARERSGRCCGGKRQRRRNLKLVAWQSGAARVQPSRNRQDELLP